MSERKSTAFIQTALVRAKEHVASIAAKLLKAKDPDKILALKHESNMAQGKVNALQDATGAEFAPKPSKKKTLPTER